MVIRNRVLLIAAVAALACQALWGQLPPLTITTTSLAQGEVGIYYSQTFTVSGGMAPYTWTLIGGTLPNNLSLSSSGVLSGTPVVSGSFPITVQVSCPGTVTVLTASASFTLDIAPAVSISTASLPSGFAGTVYSQTLAATGGVPPYTWTYTGTLPPGLGLSTAGVLSGTPTAAGSYTFTARVTDSLPGSIQGTATRSLTVVVASPLSITTTSVAQGEVGVVYVQGFTASGGTSPYTWTLATTSGPLPNGLSLSTAGTLSGTPLVSGSFPITVRVTDSTAGTAPLTTTANFTLVIAPALSITTTSLVQGIVGTVYSQTLAATGGVPPYTWTYTGTLPPGLGLSTAGVLSGTPTAAGSYSFQAQVTDSLPGNIQGTATATVSVTILAAMTISPTSLTQGEVGVNYNQAFTATGGLAPYTWSVSAGSLPSGLTLSTAGVLSGSPTTPGVYQFTVQATDSMIGTAAHSTTQPLTLTIVSAVSITTTTLGASEVGVPYSLSLAAAGGVPPYTWSMVTPISSLPPGVSLSTAGLLSGPPTTAGAYAITVRVTDTLGGTATASFTMTVSPAVSISTTSLAQGEVGLAYSQTLAAAGGVPAYTWSQASGTLPPGLSLSPLGVLSGTPTTAGSYTFTPRVMDSLNGTATASLTVVINPPVSITTTSLPQAEVGVAYSQTLAAAGGLSPYAWTTAVGGTWPAGLTFTAVGVLSGTPATAGNYTIAAQVTDSLNGTASTSLPLVVNPAVSITTTSLAVGAVGSAYSQTLAATGGVTPYAWSLASGSPPPGTTLSAAGVLSGTPTVSGSYQFTARVTDALTGTATASFTVVINAALSIQTLWLPGFAIGTPYSAQVTATGGVAPYTWAFTGTLPTTLGIDSATGLITGSYPGGAITVTVRVTDTLGATSTRTYNIADVGPPPVRIITTSLPDGMVDVVYSASLAASGGTGGYTWSLGGTLPPGLQFYSVGSIGGTPTAIGTYSFSVSVSDSGGRSASAVFSITIKPQPLVITTESPLPDTPLGAVSIAFAAKGGVLPYAWAPAGGALPPGLRINSAGVLNGTATTTGTYQFAVQVTDKAGTVATKSFTITITPPALVITTTALPDGTLGVAYSAGLAATGGAPPYQWSASGLPAGLSVNAADGAIGGTPTAKGTFTVQATVTDSKKATATRSLTLKIAAVPLEITTVSLPDGAVDVAYSATLAATGGLKPYTWSGSGNMPPGLALTANGTIAGKPTKAGKYNITVQVKDAADDTATRDFTITIAPPRLVITTTSLPNGTVGAAYSAGVAATGGVTPYRWSAAGLPAGLRLDADSGAISGTPGAAFSGEVSFQVTDSEGATASRSLPLSIGLPALPAVTYGGPSGTVSPSTQPRLTLTLGGTYPVDLTGQVVLTFKPDTGADDPAVQFSTGGRTVTFTIPANTTTAAFPAAGLALQTGTVAGVITLTMRILAGGVDITPSPAPTQTLRVPPGPPVIVSVTLTRTAAGFSALVTGYANTREVTQANFRLAAASGASLQTTDVTIAVGGIFQSWYASSGAASYGGQFAYTQPFNVQGSAGAIGSVTVTLSNSQGTSNAVTASMP